MSYRTQQAALDNLNYYSDSRVVAGMVDAPALTHDGSIVYTLWSDDGDVSEEVKVPTKFDVCPTCEGHGKHTNPSIDAGGISGDDFDRDPGFAEAYFSGVYDVRCSCCEGRRVVPVADLSRVDDETAERIRQWHRDAVEAAEERAYNLRYGC